MYLYHGSYVGKIKKLKANSKQHNGKEEKVVYLTSNYAYSLFYIWDPIKNHRTNKYVTVYIKDGIVYYEEQFPNQFYQFYNNVKGYVYYREMHDEFLNGSEESFYISNYDIDVIKFDYIDNVYENILEYVDKGLVKILYFNEQSKERQNQLVEMIVQSILKKQLIGSNTENELFLKRYFTEAYSKAVECYDNDNK